MFEDQMATYCFVEIAEGFCPSSKSSAGLEPAPELPPPSPKALSSSGSMDKPVSSPHWTMTNSSPAFVIRVPNESIVRLFSFLVSSPLHYCELASHYDVIQIRNYETKYLCSELPLEPGLKCSDPLYRAALGPGGLSFNCNISKVSRSKSRKPTYCLKFSAIRMENKVHTPVPRGPRNFYEVLQLTFNTFLDYSLH